MPGARFEASTARPPRIEAEIIAPDDILRIDVLKNGKYVYTTRPGKRTAKVSYRDLDATVGETYYYLRVFQRDPENPSGDPEAAWVSPFFVTYRD